MNYLVIITDDRPLSASLRAIFGDEYFIEEVRPGYALRAISERRPTVVILDSQLEGTNSLDVLSKLLAYDPTLTVIKLVPSFDRTAKQSLELGAFEVIEKPFDTERIKHIVKRAIERERFLIVEKKSQDNTVAGKEDDLHPEIEREVLFQSLLKIVAENFSDIDRASLEILKVLRDTFQFNRMLILIKKDNFFVPLSSLGIGDVFKNIVLNQNHPLILWLLNKRRILNLSSEQKIPFECYSFMNTINCRIAFPLLTLKGELAGIFFAGDKITGEDLTLKEISFLNMIMNYMSTVLENALLYREIFFHKEYQEAIFHNIPTGIIAVDREGKVIMFNAYAEEILGIRCEDIKDEPIEKVGSQIADFVRRTLDKEETFSRIEIDYIPAKVILGLSTKTIMDENGNINGAVVIFQDLTTIKEMEKREREAEKSKYWSFLASRLSHELKNPLVAIKTFAQMLPSKYNDAEFRENFSRIVQEEVQKINEIIERINKIADTMELKVDTVDIVGVFKECTDKGYKKGDIRFNFKGEEKIFIQADIERLRETVGYIMDFIYEDTGGSGSIDITFRRVNDMIEIDIDEKGSRINLTNGEELFVPFTPSIKSSISIGMMLARKILESHCGELKCNIKPSGKNFIITFPLNIPRSERNLAI